MGDNIAIILAGGESRRMKSKLTKVLHPILGAPVIFYVLDAARKASIQRAVIVSNPKNKSALDAALAQYQAKYPNFKTDVVIQEQALGTGHAVQAALPVLGDLSEARGSALVLCGDAPLIRASSIDTVLNEHDSKGSDVTVLSGIVPDATGYGRIVREAGAFCRIVEEKSASHDEKLIREINSGCLAIRLASLEQLLTAIPVADTGEYYLTRVIDLGLERGQKVDAVSALGESEVLGINTRRQLAQAVQIVRERVNGRLMDAGVTLVDPASTFIGPDVEIGADTTIYPHVYIEGSVNIGTDCQIGPFARIRGNCEIADGVSIGNFVEVVRSSVAEKTQVLHLSYLGDTSLGRDVNIGAGTIFANFDGQAKHSGAVGDGAFVGSGTIVVQPAQIGTESRTGAGAVVVRDIPAGETWVGVPAKSLTSSMLSRDTARSTSRESRSETENSPRQERSGS